MTRRMTERQIEQIQDEARRRWNAWVARQEKETARGLAQAESAAQKRRSAFKVVGR